MGSNHQPADYKSTALPHELQQYIWGGEQVMSLHASSALKRYRRVHFSIRDTAYNLADYCELAACRGVSFNFTLNLLSCGGVVAISAGRH